MQALPATLVVVVVAGGGSGLFGGEEKVCVWRQRWGEKLRGRLLLATVAVRHGGMLLPDKERGGLYQGVQDTADTR